MNSFNDQTMSDILQTRIESIVLTIFEDLKNERSPYFEIKGSKSIKKIEIHLEKSRPKFIAILVLLQKVYELTIKGQRQNKRDIFYENMAIFLGGTKMIDNALEALSSMLKVPRWDLGIDASSKGLIVGNLKWKDASGETVQITTSTPTLIPSDQNGFHDFESDAKFILVVEKDAIFVKLLQEECFKVLGSFLLITGKGYPDFGTRRLIRKIWEVLHIPVLLLVDANLHGLRIAATYRWGSQTCTHSDLFLTEAELIGVLPSELDYVSSDLLRTNMTDVEVKRLDSFEKRIPDDNWKREIEVLRRTKRKAEIEHLTNDSPDYLTQVYLPNKIGRYTTTGLN